MSLALLCTLIAAFAWAWLLFGQGHFWQLVLPQPPQQEPAHWPDVAIIVPARNEAAMLPHTLPALLAQDYPGRFGIIVVNDHSDDDTAAIAYRLAQTEPQKLVVIDAPALPPEWRGKVHAMHCGVVAAGEPDYILFTDADILHHSSSLRYLVARSEEQGFDLHSLMVRLRCQSGWEKLLMPAFVYFFKMLYPFQWSNQPELRVAAAAGGVMLVRNAALQESGGMAAIQGALIDDCALARAIKFRPATTPPRIWLSLTEDVQSLRVYHDLHSIWQMICRTAFTQLRFSWLLLAGTVLGLGIIFLWPVVMLLWGGFYSVLGFVLLTAMLLTYTPMVRFYRLNIIWVVTLPFAALVYLAATIDSAILHAQKRGGEWKGRVDTL